MKERPILFSAPMVKAVLDGHKTQTRRIVDLKKLSPVPDDVPFAICEDGAGDWIAWYGPPFKSVAVFTLQAYPDGGGFPCPYGQAGNRLWVRETWAAPPIYDALPPRDIPTHAPIWYHANGTPDPLAWGKARPSIFLPRWASRISLELTGVRVERVQDISDSDIRAEGVATNCNYMGRCNSSRCPEHARGFHVGTYADFEHLWRKINGAESWKSNAWVWVLEFRRVTP